MANSKHAKPTPRTRETKKRASNERPFDITRRQFLIGTGVVGAVLAVGGGTYYVTESNKDTSGQTKLKVTQDQVIKIGDLELVDDISEFLKVEREVTLDYNTLIHSNDSDMLSLLESTSEGSPLFHACAFSLASGNKSVLLSGPVTDKPRFDIFDFKTNSSGSVWVESNVFTGENIVYTCEANSDHSTNAIVAMTLGADKKMPQIIACDDYAWIQTSPSEGNSGKEELWRIKFGESGSSAEKIMETNAFATAPSWTKSGVVVTPRNENTLTSYDIRLLDATSAQIKDICSLQQSMKPQDVSWGNSGFSFSFQGSYEVGEGISQVGTYAQTNIGNKLASEDNASRDARNENLSEQTWLSFNREPTCAPAWIGDYIAFKSTSSVAIVDPKTKKYAAIKADDGADDYGVWLISHGDCDRLVTIQNINYRPLSGDPIKECQLKVWVA